MTVWNVVGIEDEARVVDDDDEPTASGAAAAVAVAVAAVLAVPLVVDLLDEPVELSGDDFGEVGAVGRVREMERRRPEKEVERESMEGR